MMPGKAAATRSCFIRSKPGNYPNRHNDENCRWSADQQLLSPQRIPALFRPAERTNFRRPFDRFSTKRADFGRYAVSHKFSSRLFPRLQGRRFKHWRRQRRSWHQEPEREINNHAGKRGENGRQHPHHAHTQRRPAEIFRQAAANAGNHPIILRTRNCHNRHRRRRRKESLTLT